MSAIVLASVNIEAGHTIAVGFTGPQPPGLGSNPRLAEGLGDPARLSRQAASEDLFRIIRQIAVAEPGVTLVAEDDLRRPGDPADRTPAPGAMVELNGNIYHYMDPGGDTSAADLGRFLASASSGYPLNAFVLPADFISLVRTQPATGGARGISPRCVINSVFDYESYAVWLPHDPVVTSR